MGEIPSLQNLWLMKQLKYRGDGSYGNSVISNLVINKYYSRDTLNIKTGYVMFNVCQTHIIPGGTAGYPAHPRLIRCPSVCNSTFGIFRNEFIHAMILVKIR